MNKLFAIKSTHNDGKEYFCCKTRISVGYFYQKGTGFEILYIDKITADIYIYRRPIFTIFNPIITCNQ